MWLVLRLHTTRIHSIQKKLMTRSIIPISDYCAKIEVEL